MMNDQSWSAVAERHRDDGSAEWQQSADVALAAGRHKAAPPAEAYRTDLATAALSAITDDTKGAVFARGACGKSGHRGRQLAVSS
jgi:hypothetical protein